MDTDNTNTILNTISQSKSRDISSYLSPSTGLFSNLLSGIQHSGGININV